MKRSVASQDKDTDNTSELRAVGAVHALDKQALADWLGQHLEIPKGPLDVLQFKGGTSNPTYLISAGEHRYVLRKKPPGQLLASAHQVAREFRVLKALNEAGLPTPLVRALCEDPTVLGADFYLMDYLPGRVFRDARLPGLPPQDRRSIYLNLAGRLADLHAVDPAKVGLADFGRPGNFFERQIDRWTRQYRSAETVKIPAMDLLATRLSERIPATSRTCITHGDYRLENVMFDAVEPRIVGILDWELSTLGDPLADLAYASILWVSKSEAWGTLTGINIAEAGIPSQSEFIDAYFQRAGVTPPHEFGFYFSFALFRLAAITQGVLKRNLDGIGTGTSPIESTDVAYLAETAVASL